MEEKIEFSIDKSSELEIAEHLEKCAKEFIPPLNMRVNIVKYANKIYAYANRFEAWGNGSLIGLLAIYCNDKTRAMAYITSVSILKEWCRLGIASHLMKSGIQHVREMGFRSIELEVDSNNKGAIRLYSDMGFEKYSTQEACIMMRLTFDKDK